VKAIIVSSSLEIESVVVVNDDTAELRAALLKNALPTGYVVAVKGVDTYYEAIEFFGNLKRLEAEATI